MRGGVSDILAATCGSASTPIDRQRHVLPACRPARPRRSATPSGDLDQADHGAVVMAHGAAAAPDNRRFT